MKNFLTSLGLERYCKTFEEGEVDMCAIDVMEESDYANLGVAKVTKICCESQRVELRVNV